MQEGFVSRELLLVWLLLVVTVVATFTIQRFRITAIPPSGAAMIIGILAGGAVRLAGGQAVQFSPAAFFYGLLPPIVFEAGFRLKKKAFFKNIGTITAFAVVGTFISTLVFGLATWLLVLLRIVQRQHMGTSPLLSCLLYGALISATDPVATLSVFAEVDVPPLLFNLVFGESVLNDAVAIVLFRTLEEFYEAPLTWAAVPQMGLRFVIIGAGSLAVGVGVAAGCAFILKRFEANFGHLDDSGQLGFDGTVYEISLVTLSAYLAYLIAEVCGMSGIVALFFSGICHAHYSYYSVAPESQTALKRFFEFSAFLSETFVFAYLGLQAATLGTNVLDWGLLISGVPLVIASRAANIFPVAAVVNKGRKVPLAPSVQTMMFAVGLRGAVAYGLVLNLPASGSDTGNGIPAVESATLVIVLATTLVFGGATGPLLRMLGLAGVSDGDVAALGLMSIDPGLSHEAALQDLVKLSRLALIHLHDGQAAPYSDLMTATAPPMTPCDVDLMLQRLAELQGAEKGDMHQRWKNLDRGTLKPLLGGRQAPRESAGASLLSRDEYHSLPDEQDMAGPTEVQLGPAGDSLGDEGAPDRPFGR